MGDENFPHNFGKSSRLIKNIGEWINFKGMFWLSKNVIIRFSKSLSSISSKTDYLIGGKNIGPGKKIKANELKIPIISETEFMDLIKN